MRRRFEAPVWLPANRSCGWTTRSAVGALVLVLGIGCVEHLDEEPLDFPTVLPSQPPAAEPLGTAVGTCSYRWPAERWMVDGFSLAFEHGAYWLFSYAPSWGGGAAAATNAAATLADPATDCAFEFVSNANGLVQAVIPFTPAEEQFNASHDDEKLALWPAAGVVHQGLGYVFYRKVLVSEDDVTLIGVGVAQLPWRQQAVRLEPGRFADEPTLMWKHPAAYWGSGALLHADGLAYVYGCFAYPQTGLTCSVARAAPAALATLAAYEYFDGTEWIASPEQVAAVVDSDHVSLAFNPALAAYLQVSSKPGSLVATLAPTPWGPFEPNEHPLLALDGSQYWRGVRQHPAYQSDDGRRLTLSHIEVSSWGDDLTTAVRVVEVELD